MKIINSITDLRTELFNINSTIGFVPTMGALHNGHLSLIDKSKSENELTICSIFVNKEQFNNSEDFNKYPINTDVDIKLLEKNGCDILFLPTSDEIYSEKPIIKFDFGHLETTMEGAFRPGHFSGVALIVSKLFNIVNPNKAYFGQKDFQQLAIIKQLVKDLSFNIDIVSCPTIREQNGLAMSSRNLRLSKSEQGEAALIYKSLEMTKDLLIKKPISEIKSELKNIFNNSNIDLEYLEIVDSNTLISINEYNIENETTICIAAHLGNVRLIDNINV